MLKGCLIAFAVTIAIVIAAGWWLFEGSQTPPVKFDCRLTLEVETPEGERSGSGVVQVYRGYVNAVGRSLGQFASTITLGDAVVVDLGSEGRLFVLLVGAQKRDDPKGIQDPFVRLVLSLFPMARFHGTWPAGRDSSTDTEIKAEWHAYADELERLKPQADVSHSALPQIVRLRDLNDPTSVEVVHPNDLARTFGSGVKLKRAILAITADPPTLGIDRILPWAKNNEALAYQRGVWR